MSEPGTVGSGIQLQTVLRFIDISVDDLAGARREATSLALALAFGDEDLDRSVATGGLPRHEARRRGRHHSRAAAGGAP